MTKPRDLLENPIPKMKVGIHFISINAFHNTSQFFVLTYILRFFFPCHFKNCEKSRFRALKERVYMRKTNNYTFKQLQLSSPSLLKILASWTLE